MQHSKALRVGLLLGLGSQLSTAVAQAQDSNAAKSSPGAAASRAVAKGGGLYRNSDWDLVDKFKDDPKLDIAKIPEEQLSDELKKMKPEERVKFVKERLAEREAIQKEIADLSKARDEHIRAEIKKNAKAGEQAFDEAVRTTIREQAAKKGIKIPE